MEAKKLMTGILTLAVVALMIAPSLWAQSLVSGDITGTVTDPTGAVVAGAMVTAKNNGTGQTVNTKSSSSGSYRFSLLPPGTYTVTANAQGFTKAQTTAAVNVGQATIADVKLAVGSNSTTVEVTSAAPLVQADNANMSTNFNQTLIANAPNPGNDLTYIAQTAPGVNMNSGMGYGNFNVAGLPSTSNVFTMNGENQMDPYLNLNNSGATNLMLGKNDVQEATVINNAYSGQYGQQAGAQVNYVSKSGTNAFHGNLEYYWTGSRFDANSYLNNLTGTPLPFNNNNEWAASIGGPIKKDKLFFFLDTEGIRYIIPSTQTVFVPTTGFANATLANIAATNPVELPLYSKAFSLYESAPGYNTGVPLGTASCQGYSGPAGISCFQSYTANPSEPATEFLVIPRIDYNMSDRDHMFWSVSIDHGTQATGADPINPAFNALSYQPQYNGQGQWTHVFGANATNQFVYAGSYYRAIFEQANAPATFPTQLDLSGLGYTSLGGQFGGGAGEFIFPQGRNATQYQFVDDFSITKGEHSLRFGANFRRYDITDYVFSEGANPLSIFNSVDSLYTGTADVFLQNFATNLSEPVALWGLGVYAQDEWAIRKNLKLTFALRAEHNSNPVCQTNCSALLYSSFYGTSTDPTAPYDSQVDAFRHQIFRSVDAIDWAPRFGFAWSPYGNDKTVLRGGFGIFYDALPAVLGDTFMTNLPTYVPTVQGGVPWADQTTPGVSPWIIAANSAAAIRSGFSNGGSFASISAGVPGFTAPAFGTQTGTFHIPQYQEWSLQLEQQLDSRSSASIAYIGNHGVNEPVTNFPNAAYPTGVALAGLPATPYSGNLSNVTEIYSGAVSNDNQITASYQRRLTYGLTVQASYTWAHALDEISNGGALPYAAESTEYQFNPFNLRSNYGDADYDIRNSFNAQYVWQTPWKFNNKYVDGALGGWTLSQNFFVRSGLPLTVLDETFSPLGFPGGDYVPANVVGAGQGSCNIYLTGCLNSAGFTSAGALATFPNQVRNAYRGPGFFDSDLSVNKNFKITERVAFGVGANAYNVFNHSNFANPINAYGAPTFGTVNLQAVPPTGPFGSFFAGAPSNRILQFQGKIVF